jgi:SAM-dependent methyltransferase
MTDELKRTDWEAYYRMRSSLTSLYTKRVLKRYFGERLKKYWPSTAPLKVAELGGSHSFFYPYLEQRFPIAEYHIIDSQSPGPRDGAPKIRYHRQNILDLEKDSIGADIVLSAGLIEHFRNDKAIESHFSILKPGGLALISFPVPTLSYNLTRGCLEKAGLWIFHDEIPIHPLEARERLSRYGDVLEAGLVRPLPLTQALLVVRARS